MYQEYFKNKNNKLNSAKWFIQYYLADLDEDNCNSIYENPLKEIIINAVDIESAIKIARQYAYEKSLEFKEWKNTTILSVIAS